MEKKFRYEDHPEFNKRLDSSNSFGVEIRGIEEKYVYKASRALFTLDLDAYQEELATYEIEKKELLFQTVINEFPNPIAHYFRRSQKEPPTGIRNSIF